MSKLQEMQLQILDIAESLRGMWVKPQHESLLNSIIDELELIDVGLIEDEKIILKLKSIESSVSKLEIHPNEVGEWLFMNSQIIMDIRNLINRI
jgi:hypothetical protein